MVTRRASCSCGKLSVTCQGEPVRISMCHCNACQKRTGSVFGTQARFKEDQISAISGDASAYTRLGDSGKPVTFHFCPECGSTVYWEIANAPGLIAVPVGAFADPSFPPPRHSVYEDRQHSWALAAGELPMEHLEYVGIQGTLMPNCSIEFLLDAIEREVSAQKAELSLLVPSRLTLRGVEVSADVGMAIILDKLLSEGFLPAGFAQQSDGRLYRYERR